MLCEDERVRVLEGEAKVRCKGRGCCVKTKGEGAVSGCCVKTKGEGAVSGCCVRTNG